MAQLAGSPIFTPVDARKSLEIPVVAATAASGAATANGYLCRITSESLTTAAAAEYTLTLTNNKIDENSILLVSAHNGTSTQGTLATGEAKPGAGTATITVTNTHASDALNGTIVIDVLVLNPTRD